jgi:Tol biopolymer transport system component
VLAAPFDVDRLELTADAVQMLDGVEADGNDTHFAVARDGTLAYVPAASRKSRLVWFDREGKTRPLDNEPREYSHPRISPDGSRVVVRVQQEAGGGELWIYDVSRGTRARLSPIGPRVSRPIWTADGARITFQYNGDLYSVPADDSGPPDVVVKRKEEFSALFPLAWSKDGRVLAFSAPAAATNRDVWMLPQGGALTPFLVTPRDERAATFSPDGRWVVYAIRETGREEQVFIQPYPGPGGRVVVSPGGGMEPMWSPTGREIFYRSIDGTRMMVVDVRTSPTLSVGPPRVLFAGQFAPTGSGGSFWSDYDVSPDGEHFLTLAADEVTTPRFNVIVGWTEGLRR